MSVAFLARRLKLTGIAPPARGAVIDELTRTHAAPVTIVITDELRSAAGFTGRPK